MQNRREVLQKILLFSVPTLAGCFTNESKSHDLTVINSSDERHTLTVEVRGTETVLFTKEYSIDPQQVNSDASFRGAPRVILLKQDQEIVKRFEYQPDVQCSRPNTESILITIDDDGYWLTYQCES